MTHPGQLNLLEVQLSQVVGRPVQPVRIDRVAFETFCADYQDKRPIDGGKRLEYYVSTHWLELSPGDRFIDIAAQDCPYASYVRKTFGCHAYRQDLYYMKPGIHGFDIGGDAANLPLPTGAVSKIALHNSFEHFEGDSDTRFIREAQRVLAPGGIMCVVPLFIAETFTEETEAGWIDSEGNKHLWGLGARFARHYDVAQFKRRVVDHSPEFAITVYRVENAAELTNGAYLQYFAIFRRQ